MKQKKIITYILDFALSNTYLGVIIQCVEIKIFNEKVEVLFYKKIEYKLNFLIKYLRL